MLLLDQCNLRCKHCYVGDQKFTPRQMPTLDTVKDWVDKIETFSKENQFKSTSLHLSGGEPFARLDIFEILDYCKSKNISTFILSNGTLFTKETADKLMSRGIKNIQFSIEGPEEINDNIRGKGVYQKVMNAIKIAKEQGMGVTVSITLSKNNISIIKDFIKELDHLNLMFHIRELMPIGDGAHMNIITPNQRKDFFEFSRDYSGKSIVKPEDPIQCSIKDGKVRKGGCVAMRNHFCIDVDGSIFPCGLLRENIGNINNLQKVYNSEMSRKLRNRELEGKCGECDMSDSCGGCRAYAFYESKSMLAEDNRCLLETM
jgi:AdoMet-dependent heme synthase